MIITAIVAILLSAAIAATVWVLVSTKNIPDIQKNTVRKLKQKLSINDCIKAYQNRAAFIKKNKINENENLLGDVEHIINGIKKNNNYDIFMAYSRLHEIDDKIKSSLTNNKQGY